MLEQPSSQYYHFTVAGNFQGAIQVLSLYCIVLYCKERLKTKIFLAVPWKLPASQHFCSNSHTTDDHRLGPAFAAI